MDDEPRRGRAKPQKLRVTFPDGTIYCYSSVKETFLETLRKIGASKLSKVKLEVCHLPMFTKTPYELYKDFMEPVGDGLYVNIQGSTYNRYSQLVSINNQLNLGLQIDLSSDIKGERIARGSKGMAVLEVTFPDHTVIGEESTSETFMQCIWHLGIDNVRKLNLKQGGKDLITAAKLYKGQVQVDENRWLVIPGSLKDKVKILRVIGLMLHIKMDIFSFSTGENKSYKRIGSQKSHRKEVKEIQSETGGKLKKGDHVYNEIHGEGIVLDYDKATRKYRVRFYIKYDGLPEEKQERIVMEEYLDFMRKGALPKVNDNSAPTFKQSNNKNIVKKSIGRKFNIGDTVYDIRYGEGQIVSLPYGSNTYEVRFPSLRESIGNTRFINWKDLQLQKRSKKTGKRERESSVSLTTEKVIVEKKFQKGDKVYNKKYGEGVVLECYPRINDYRVQFFAQNSKLPLKKLVFLINEKFLESFDCVNKGKRSPKGTDSNEKDNNIILNRKASAKEEKTNSISKKEYKIGDKVYCKKFGTGIVKDVLMDGNLYMVRFPFYHDPSGSSNHVFYMKYGDLLPFSNHINKDDYLDDGMSLSTKKPIAKDIVYPQIFKVGEYVSNINYGIGVILHFYNYSNTYDVRFTSLPTVKQVQTIKGTDLHQTKQPSIIGVPKKKENNITKRKSHSHLSSPIQKFKKGDRVYNERFGWGIVTQYYKYSKGYDVLFDKDEKENKLRYIKEDKLEYKDEKENNEDFSGNATSHVPAIKDHTDSKTSEVLLAKGLFKEGEKVYSKIYGEGIVLEFYSNSRNYKVRFYEKFHNLAPKNQSLIINERFISRSADRNEDTTPESENSKNTEKIHLIEHKNDNQTSKEETNITESKDIDIKGRKFKVGDKIYNKKYGRGKIIEPIPNTHVYQVKFPFYKEESYKDKEYFINEKDMVPLTYQIVEHLTMLKENNVSKNTEKYEGYKDIKRNDGIFKVGDEVYSIKFGVGVIKQYYNYSKTYDIEFSDFATTGEIHNLKEDNIEPYKDNNKDKED